MSLFPHTSRRFIPLCFALVFASISAPSKADPQKGIPHASEGPEERGKPSALLRKYNLHKAHVPGSLIVRFKETRETASLKLSLLRGLGGRITHTFGSSGAHVVRFADGSLAETELAERAAALEQSGQVEWVEANTRLHAVSGRTPTALPNDPDFTRLWGLSNFGQDQGTAGVDINVTPAWNSQKGNSRVLVGIIDTGLDRSHPDLAPNAWKNPKESGTDAQGLDRATNGVDDDANGFIDDVHGWDFVNNDNDPFDDNEHGTHVGGTVGARGNNGVGIAGVAWNVSLVGLKFLDSEGSGSLEDAVKAIEYATRLGVHITNNSWGGGGYSPTMKAAIDEAAKAGILFVAASGNDSNDNDAQPSYPASYSSSNIISVAAVDSSGRLADFSNRGARSVHLGAPGVAIYSTVPNASYASFDGTSMATPHVVGAAALLKASFPAETAERLRARLLANTRPLASLAGMSSSGGLLNVTAALEVDTRAPARVEDLRILAAGISSMDVEWSESGDDALTGRASSYLLRSSRRPVVSEEGWLRSAEADVRILGRTPSGRVRARVLGLPLGASGHFTVRAVDNVGNVSALSESIPFATVALKTTAVFDAESLEGITVTGTWGLEATGEGSNQAFSDNPDGPYSNLQETTLTLPSRPLKGRLGVITYLEKTDLEDSYDFGLTDVSTDGGTTFTTVARTTGTTSDEGWRHVTIDISPWLKADNNNVIIRFRLKTDFSETQGGWLVDNVTFQSPN
ncbi:MAG: S8 family serine peptidase [Silvanigrellales bacterium]|nr:S8 family serine peptidase [Silvanigrellales bacterium]